MNRFYVFKDCTQIGSTATREEAIEMIRQHQKCETHYMLRSQFSIIYGEEEFVPYVKGVEMFTIKSTSDEGVFYLVNHWQKHKTYWIEPEKVKADMLFKSAADAKRSLTKLLKTMEDYRSDKFEVVKLLA